MPKIIGYERISEFSDEPDRRCVECRDFSAYAREIFEGEDFECAYCGTKWRDRSDLEKESKGLDRRYGDGCMTWAEYKAANRDLYLRAVAESDEKVIKDLEDWANDHDGYAPELRLFEYMTAGTAVVETREYGRLVSRLRMHIGDAQECIRDAVDQSKHDGINGHAWQTLHADEKGARWSADGEVYTTITFAKQEA
jgi:hypothetical protein